MQLPRMRLIRQVFPSSRDMDVRGEVKRALAGSGILDAVRGGERVLITAGSRGISGMPETLAAVAEAVMEKGASPLIMPAMGSHGGATAEGQVLMLRHLGITAESVGAPIYDKMEPLVVGRIESHDVPVYADALCRKVNHIILVNRIKEHTEYVGDAESGLLKMAVVGLGRRMGAEWMHRLAVNITYRRAIEQIARVLFDALPVAGGVAIIEDSRNRPARIIAMRAEEIFEKEPELLAEATKYKAKLPFDELDLLVVDEMGKEISGAGMDTKVIGRIMNIYEREPEKPRITRIVVRSLTEATEGNAIGVGLADYIHRRLAEKINPISTNINCIVAVAPEKARIPITAQNDRELLEHALATIGVWKPETVRVLWVINTAELEYIAASEGLEKACREKDDIELVGDPFEITFDPSGNMPFLRDIVKRML